MNENLKLSPYIPDIGLEYPGKPDEHLILKPREVDLILDENYPFLDKSPWFRFRSALIYLGIFTLVFVISPIRFGLRIEGRKILKKHRALFRRGALTVSNHVFRWDFLCILQAVRFRRLYFPAWKENISGSDRNLIRLVGGIPVPTDIHVMRSFSRAFDELHEQGKWFHVFPEGSNWPYYQPIRPFKKGMFTMAYRYNIPIIPMAFSYRPAGGLYRLFKKNYPLITLRMGEPILPDLSLSRKEAVNLLRAVCHRRITELAGIQNNPWPCEGD
ncbi:MAG: 1-acyl-sn-glycerol-3-phosphate acyltransferase [Spirochaetaceae bacterium]|jgi:1-acyl-sn-glycerol-3-phosphate acyltransferase|nr:1-acyl-sn-glycerol-3-phosphate acyltransferase [Spirochaetaceae bacterium]